MSQHFLFFVSTLLVCSTAQADQWFRDNAEFFAYRTQRQGLAADPSSKITTDGKRFDMTVGNRIPVYAWDDSRWSLGVDGGMLASLERFSREGTLTFATETFDGFFGAYLGRLQGDWLFMLRTAHLSAHLVDNAPEIFTNTRMYNVFWTEAVVGYSVLKESSWDLYLQGSFGANTTATPDKKNPRGSFSFTLSRLLAGKNSLEGIVSVDIVRTGIDEQKTHTASFIGFGRTGRSELERRPFRAGISVFRGSDHRNQYYFKKSEFTALTVHTDF